MPSRVFPKEGETLYSHMLITDCSVKSCRHDGRKEHYHTPNPNGQAMKATEMTVRRAINLVAAFDELVEEYGTEADWQLLKLSVWREVFGTLNPTGRELPVLWDRYQDRTLHHQVLELADNLVLEDLAKDARKEIKDGIRRIRKELDS